VRYSSGSKPGPVARESASGCNTPTANLDAPTSSSKNIKDKLSDWPAEKQPAACRVHWLPLSNRRGWKQLVFKNVCT